MTLCRCRFAPRDFPAVFPKVIIARNPPRLARFGVRHCSRFVRLPTWTEGRGELAPARIFSAAANSLAGGPRTRRWDSLHTVPPSSDNTLATKERHAKTRERARRPACPAMRTSSFVAPSLPCSTHPAIGRRRSILLRLRAGDGQWAGEAGMLRLRVSRVACPLLRRTAADKRLIGRPPRVPAHDLQPRGGVISIIYYTYVPFKG
jgi:hypothetical protein